MLALCVCIWCVCVCLFGCSWDLFQTCSGHTPGIARLPPVYPCFSACSHGSSTFARLTSLLALLEAGKPNIKSRKKETINIPADSLVLVGRHVKHKSFGRKWLRSSAPCHWMIEMSCVSTSSFLWMSLGIAQASARQSGIWIY